MDKCFTLFDGVYKNYPCDIREIYPIENNRFLVLIYKHSWVQYLSKFIRKSVFIKSKSQCAYFNKKKGRYEC